MEAIPSIPNSASPDLHLAHPTEEELTAIWTSTHSSWGDSLQLPEFLAEALFLYAAIPLRIMSWMLVDKQRRIFCSCDTFRKRALISDKDGMVTDAVMHGVASVFCPEEKRGRGYAGRMMRELAKSLSGWQAEGTRVVGSVLFSDIGKRYYANLGWNPSPRNSQLVFQATSCPPPTSAKKIQEADLADLCARDEVVIRCMLRKGAVKERVIVVPDLDHMLFHMRKEDFVCEQIFGKIPSAKGATAGQVDARVWAIWTHRYYQHPDSSSNTSKNTLYILRLVLEKTEKIGTEGWREQVGCLREVVRSAQAEAREWRLDQVVLWDPSPVVREIVRDMGVECVGVEREEEGIASALWYDEQGEVVEDKKAPEWACCEYYAWC